MEPRLQRPRATVGVAEVAFTTTNTSPAVIPLIRFGNVNHWLLAAVNCITGRPLSVSATTVGSLATVICTALLPPPLPSCQMLTLPAEVAWSPLSAISQSLIPESGMSVPLASVVALTTLLYPGDGPARVLEEIS